MPVVNLVTLQDVLGGTEPVDAIVTATVYRGSVQAIRIKDDEVTFPDDIRVKVVNGVPVEPLILEHLEADCYYKIDVFVSGTQPYRANVVLPAGDGPFDIADLIVVDPTTYIPTEGTTLADAFIQQITALRDGMIVGGEVVGDNLILTQVDGATINAGNVRGPVGPQGPRGEDGFVGSDGASAYDVAVENGFIGTEEEWLEYLRQGPAGRITIGSTAASEPGGAASVTNTGTDTDAILNFTLPRGEQGPQGIPGETQTIAYTHNQTAVSSTWVINHGLTFQPGVQIVDSAGTTIEGVVNYNSSSQLTVQFSVALSGTAYLS